MHVPRVLAHGLGRRRRERRADFGRDVAEIADDVHDFMIAGEDDGLADGALGLLLEPHQQIHHLAHVGAAVGVVAGLHPDRAPTAPLQRIVDEAGAAEDGGDPVVETMNVADGDEDGLGIAR